MRENDDLFNKTLIMKSVIEIKRLFIEEKLKCFLFLPQCLGNQTEELARRVTVNFPGGWQAG